MTQRPIRVLLFAPANEILGGQAIQAQHILRFMGSVTDIEMQFQPINPLFPAPLRWVKRIPFARTAVNMLLYLSIVFRRARWPDILHIFTAGLYSYTLWTIPVLIAGKLYGKKIIIDYHDGQCEQHLRQYPSAKRTLPWGDALVTPSGFVVDVFARHGFTVRRISNVLDAGNFHYRSRSVLRPVFLTNRILEPLYNVECILRAFRLIQARYPQATLTIAHDGPSRHSLETYASELGLRHTRFIGKVPHDEVARLYDEADIYITTPNFDCMPGSLLECFASGLPLIATRVAGIPYIVTDEVNGLLVERDDHEAVARQAFRLLEDPALVERLTAAGLQEVERYRSEPVRDQWAALYRELIQHEIAQP